MFDIPTHIPSSWFQDLIESCKGAHHCHHHRFLQQRNITCLIFEFLEGAFFYTAKLPVTVICSWYRSNAFLGSGPSAEYRAPNRII